jgi:AraC-like DNA-binding protein
MPPGVPFNDGSQPHWFGEDEETPDSLIFWISCTPQGADLHLCRTLNGVHKSLFPAFVQDDHILRVAELLLEDLQKTSPQLTATAHHYLSAILLRVLYALQSDRQHAPMQQLFPPVESHHDEAGAESGGEALLAERACRFIQTRLITQLTVQQIADHLYVSPSHLNRVFKRQMGVSPMKYVTQRRMEIARTMLLNTKYPILYISNFFGYSHPDVFSRAFKESFGVSPKNFRRRV